MRGIKIFEKSWLANVAFSWGIPWNLNDEIRFCDTSWHRFIFTVIAIYPGSSLFFISACERSAGCSRGIKSERHEKGTSWKTKDTRKSDTELLFFLPPQPSYLIYSCMIHIFRTKFHNDLYVRFNACTLIYCYR